MPFAPEVKTSMFIRCHRFCCLCRKQCGTNIEAAHIIDESAGGSNEADNGIPLCFDCHQEIGGYNDRHPKGNKFRPEELRARRDQIYGMVAQGIFPQMIAGETLLDDSVNHLHQIIDLLVCYHNAFGKLHHASTRESMVNTANEWRSYHSLVWVRSNIRDETIRRLVDPAKEWLGRLKSPYVNMEDFDLIEQCVVVISGFAVSPTPMSMPTLYSNEYLTEEKLWKQWKEQEERYFALGGLV